MKHFVYSIFLKIIIENILLMVDDQVSIVFEHILEHVELLMIVFLQLLILKDVFDVLLTNIKIKHYLSKVKYKFWTSFWIFFNCSEISLRHSICPITSLYLANASWETKIDFKNLLIYLIKKCPTFWSLLSSLPALASSS